MLSGISGENFLVYSKEPLNLYSIYIKVFHEFYIGEDVTSSCE